MVARGSDTQYKAGFLWERLVISGPNILYIIYPRDLMTVLCQWIQSGGTGPGITKGGQESDFQQASVRLVVGRDYGQSESQRKNRMRTRAIMLAASLCVAGCALQPASKLSTTTPRVFSLNDREVSEADTGGVTSWVCRNYIEGGKIVVEVGYFNDPQLNSVGFVLYDGKNSGVLASYGRAGLLHRWDWEWNDNRNAYTYSFLIRPDGTGLYYDFSTATDGHKDKADDIFKCQSR